MNAHRMSATLQKDGMIVLQNLPFHKGDSVEIIVLKNPSTAATATSKRYPLRGRPYKYIRPTDPVDKDEWEANR